MARPEHVFRIAQLKLIRDSAELEAEISTKAPGWFFTVYKRFRDAAADSITGLAFVEPNNTGAIEALQLDIKVYDRFIEEVRAFINEGIHLDRKTTDEDRDEVLDILMAQGPEGAETAVQLGLIDPGPPDA